MNNVDKSHHTFREITRRRFTWLIASGAFFLGSLPATYFMIKGWGLSPPPSTSRILLDGAFKELAPYEATVIQDVAALIIPTDDTPGATEAGVVYELDRLIAGVDRYRELYHLGIAWLDRKASVLYQKPSFLDLKPKDQETILTLADIGEISYIEKWLEVLLHGQSNVGKRFFNLVKKQTFHIFYTSPIGWGVVGYQNPPQWSEHPNYFRCG